MSKTLIQGALIVTMNDEKPGHFYGDILTNNDQIENISEKPDSVKPELADRVIDGSNLIVMPGFINTHGHAAMSLLRSYADDMPLTDWLVKKIWPIETLLESDDIYWGSMLSIAEMIKGGTTTFTDMYFFMDRVAEAAAESGIRAVLSRGLSLFGLGIDEGGFKETKKFINDWHGAENGRITVMLGPHAIYTGSPDFYRSIVDLAGETGLSLQIHLSETKIEVESSFEQHGCSPVKLLYDLGLFDHKVLAAHCVHLSKQDIELLAEKNVGVSHNPGSNLKLGSGIAPVRKMLEAGITVGIGTDGASSNNNLDMVEEMRLAALLGKGLEMDPTLINAVTALQMSTSMGAEALSLGKVGVLREGYKADLIGFRHDRPHLTPMHDPQSHLVYASAAADVCLVMVDGKLLLENGELTTLDEEKIRAEASRKATRLVNAGKDNH